MSPTSSTNLNFSEHEAPLYRAKQKGTNNYVIGWYFQTSKQSYIIPLDSKFYFVEIERDTLSIHHHDMLDSQGNKIFASLSEYGKGGDITEANGLFNGTTVYENQSIYYGSLKKEDFYSWSKIKVIGIQE